ncbi:MAG: glycosyltransferase family 9 protein [Niabella sp.]
MKILVIQLQKIGDVLTSSILCDNLRKIYPAARIDFLCYENCAAILNGNPYIDEVVTLSKEVKNSYPKFWKFIKNIRKRKYDAVIDAYSKIGSNLITYFSKARYRTSFDKPYSRIFYTHNIKRLGKKDSVKNGHAIDNRLMLLQPLVKQPLTEIRPRIHLLNEEREKAQALLERYHISGSDKPLVMFGVIGSEWYKTFPLKKMASIIDFTVSRLDANIIFNYLPMQKDEAYAVYNYCNETTKKHIYFDLYADDLRVFLALLDRCDMLVGNEGGAVNMAKALNVPTFSIFSPSTDKESWQLFEDKRNLSVHLKDIKPEIYGRYDEKHIKKNTFAYFEEYPMDLIFDMLEQFFINAGCNPKKEEKV